MCVDVCGCVWMSVGVIVTSHVIYTDYRIRICVCILLVRTSIHMRRMFSAYVYLSDTL